MMKNFKNIKGITLISLVITIIVLLLLVGISISMLSGENSIMSKAGESVYLNSISQFYERVGIISTAIKMDIQVNMASDNDYIATFNGEGANAKKLF